MCAQSSLTLLKFGIAEQLCAVVSKMCTRDVVSLKSLKPFCLYFYILLWLPFRHLSSEYL